MKRTTCSGCGYDDLHLFLDLGSSPIADAYTSTASELSERYPLQLAVCSGCHLVQLLEVVSGDVLFGTGYSFYSSASPPLSRYHETYARSVITSFGDLAQRLTVEIGCNDGDLLQHFAAANCRVVGVDPAGGPVEVARNRGLPIIQKPFTQVIADQIRAEYGTAGVVIANHVLAHVENVSQVLEAISHVLSSDGVAFIEVQYLADMLVNNAFDLVYHEHRNFFSLSSLESAARRWGLYLVNTELTDRQGGSLRVVLSKMSELGHVRARELRTSEGWLRSLSTYSGVQGRVERVRTRLLRQLDTAHSQELTVVGYGAPAKATTLLNFCGVDQRHIRYVVDTTPAKQGRFIPGTGIQIQAPNESYDTFEADVYLLLAWNYAEQIMRNNTAFTAHGGRWIVPIPAPVML